MIQPLYVDGAQVVITDIQTGNVVIHIIDSVIPPKLSLCWLWSDDAYFQAHHFFSSRNIFKKALAAFEVKGTDLQYVEERLRPEYYIRWMLDPQRIIPLTKMPKFATDGLTALPEFEGDAKKQFEAMWEFLRHGRKIPEVK